MGLGFGSKRTADPLRIQFEDLNVYYEGLGSRIERVVDPLQTRHEEPLDVKGLGPQMRGLRPGSKFGPDNKIQTLKTGCGEPIKRSGSSGLKRGF